MKIWYGLSDIPADFNASVVTIGVFDGIHIGHRNLISQAVADGQRRGVPTVLMTFSPHPMAVFAPDKAPVSLISDAQCAEIAAELGVDYFLIVPFDRDFAAMEPQHFVADILATKLAAQAVYVGQNFTYGAKAAGTSETLVADGSRLGIAVHIADLIQLDGARVSSTRVRQALAAGDVAEARRCLGRPYRVCGEVIRGQGRGGAQLGFPTANIDFSAELAVPADGVYAGWFTATSGNGETSAEVEGDMEFGIAYPAAISVGTNVTFEATERTVEAYVIGKNADLYGAQGCIEFIEHIRGMEKFDGIEALVAQMKQDVAEATEILDSDRRSW